MPIKKTPILSKEDFEEAIVSLRLSISELARETAIPRQYLSHFRSYGDGLKPEQVAKVRDYLEAKLAENGMALEGRGDETEAEGEPTPQAAPTLSDLDTREDMARALLCVRHFALSPALDCDQITAALERMDTNDTTIRALLAMEAVHGFMSEWDSKTESRLQEVFGLLAENFLLFRHLQGRSLVPLANLTEGVDEREIKTIGDLMAGLLAGSLRDMGDKLKPKAAPAEEPDTTQAQPIGLLIEGEAA